MDAEGWRGRLTELIAEHEVPGAALAVWQQGTTAGGTTPGGTTTEVAAGVLSLDTGVEVTPDSLFQIGSVTKVWTTTQVMLLVEQGRLSMDTPVAEVLDEFALADPAVTSSVTVRHLLSHTSGIDGDLFLDTGRGDDCVQRYVAACADLPQLHPPGATHSYCNAGFVVLGRIIERLGKGWDAALREQVIEPLGLTRTWTLPEDVLRFRAATGHLGGRGGEPVHATPQWGLPRAIGPAGLICASAADVVTFGRAHLRDGGQGETGQGGLLAPRSLAAMREAQVVLPNEHIGGTHWGLGWLLDDWDGQQVLLHGGNTIGQAAMLWVLPGAGVVACLLANGGRTDELQQAVATELFAQLAGVHARVAPEPPSAPAPVDPARWEGRYERTSMRMTLTQRNGSLHARVENTGPLARLAPPVEMPLVALDDTTLLGRQAGEGLWNALVRFTLPDGTPYVHFGARATPRVG